MKNIGIIGGGVAGLHLGLQLRQHEIPVTIYTNRTPEQIRDGRVLNSVVHMHATQELEADLGIDHWPGNDYKYFAHYHYNGWGEGRTYRGDLSGPSRVIDYRIYLPQLMRDFIDRGGVIEYRDLSAGEIHALSDVHDLVVVSTGKGEIGAMFPRRTDRSYYDRPQRKLAVGFWQGVRRRDPNGVEISVVPGTGELMAIPMWSFSGPVMALLFESVPGGAQEILTDQRFESDPEAYRELTLRILREQHPTVFERVDVDSFKLQSDKDILQGAVTPVLREDYVRLPNGKFLLALGDVHLTVDPTQAQGANAAAYSARVLGNAILEDEVYDERFMEKVARRRAERTEATNDWVNMMIQTPRAPQFATLFEAMADNKALLDEFTDNFNDPIRQLDLLGSQSRVEAAIARTSMDRALSAN